MNGRAVAICLVLVLVITIFNTVLGIARRWIRRRSEKTIDKT